jgi:dethiobiotin synthetase
MKRFFVTGTDTEIGKTTIAAGILYAAHSAGLTTAGVKPVAAGCDMTADGPRNDDALALLAQCRPALEYQQVNPIALEAAIAPHIAAQEEGVALGTGILAEACQAVFALQRDLTLVEGAGGWLVPLNPDETLADLAKTLQAPVIMVVGMRLGCINHALLTAQAIERDGLKLAGWVANHVDPHMSRPDENMATLTQLLAAPCLGRVPTLERASAELVAQHLSLSALQL